MKKILLFFSFIIFAFSVLLSNCLNNTIVYATKSDYTAKSLFLMDYDSEQVLFENNSLEKLPIASIVKLMTIYLTCEQIESGKLCLEDKVIASENASGMGGSQVFIETGGEYSVEDLLKSTIISSANDASVALAEKIAGAEEDFVILMNKKARELGLSNTNYANCTGLPTSNQFSCARDVAKLLKHVSSFKTYHNYSTIWLDAITHPNNRETELVNTNKLIRYFEGCDGGKTGSTSEAGYCLSATAKRGNMRLIGVVLGAKTGKLRFAETAKLLNYGFSNFENKQVVNSSGTLNQKVNVKNGVEKVCLVKPEQDAFVVTNKHESNNIQIQVKLTETIKAPVKCGEIVGTLYVLNNGEVVKEINLITTQNINKASLLQNMQQAVNNWAII